MIPLPEELIVRILEELDVNDLLNCSLTCRPLYDTIRDALVLQYHIELAIASMEDCGAASSFTIADRLAELKAVEESWGNLRFRRRHLVPMRSSNLWELFGGFIARGLTDGLATGLQFIELPSAVRGTDGRTWEHPNMGVHIRDFAIDPAQDLVVLIANPVDVPGPHMAPAQEYLIHLRAMSTGMNHPRAAAEVISSIPNPVNRGCNFIIQIMDQFLAILFHTVTGRSQDQLFIWNWMTGQLVTDCRPAPTNRIRIDSFSFLSPRHFIVPRFQADAWAQRPPNLEVYDFLAPGRPAGSTTPRLVRSFQLPPLSADAIMASILTRSDPSPQCSAQRSRANAGPFYTAPTSRLLTISIDVLRRMEDFRTFVLFVHHSALLDGLELEPPPRTVVPWEEWGPKKSRMLPTLYNEPSWVCYVHGTRYVRLESVGEPFGVGVRSHLRMLDFNPLILKRDWPSRNARPLSPAAGSETSCEIFSASQPTVIPAENGFAEDVETSLPYRDIRSGETFRYNAVMIDEECVVGLVQGTADLNDSFQFLCF